MFTQINKELHQLREQVATYERNEDRLKRLKQRQRELTRQVRELESKLRAEQLDVENLTRNKVAKTFYQLLGNYQAKVTKEENEALEAELRYAQAKRQLDECEEDIKGLTIANQSLRYCKADYEALYHQKYDLLRSKHSDYADAMMQIEQQIGHDEALLKEIKEAIEAGNTVMQCLNDTLSSLESAKNWGVFDMVGGGLVADVAKHSHLDQARDHAARTQRLMHRFKTELTDVKLKANIQIEMDGFTKFADFFFDGFLMDFLVQSKINDSYDDVSSVKRQVSQVLSKLSTMKNKVESDITSKQLELETFIHQA